MFYKALLMTSCLVFSGVTLAQVKGVDENFTVVQGRVQTLEARISSTEVEIRKLIEEKQKTTNVEKTNEIIRNMVSLHKQMADFIKEYDQQRNLLKYRYPDKGQAASREYERIELRSLEEMEARMTLGSAVDQTMKKVRSQYGSASEAPSKNPEVDGKSKNKAAPTGADSLMDPVILKK